MVKKVRHHFQFMAECQYCVEIGYFSPKSDAANFMHPTGLYHTGSRRQKI